MAQPVKMDTTIVESELLTTEARIKINSVLNAIQSNKDDIALFTTRMKDIRNGTYLQNSHMKRLTALEQSVHSVYNTNMSKIIMLADEMKPVLTLSREHWKEVLEIYLDIKEAHIKYNIAVKATGLTNTAATNALAADQVVSVDTDRQSVPGRV